MDKEKQIREKIAELCHTQWSNWMKYLFDKCIAKGGSMVIPAWAYERWLKQSETPYEHLSSEEQDSDRKEADKFIAMLDACPTCGGSEDSKASVVDDLSGGIVDTEIPCPDCQSQKLPEAAYCMKCGKITDDLDEGSQCPDCQPEVPKTEPVSEFVKRMHNKYPFIKFHDARLEIGKDLTEACDRLEAETTKYQLEKDANAILIQAKEIIANENEKLRTDLRAVTKRADVAEVVNKSNFTAIHRISQESLDKNKEIKQLQAKLKEQTEDIKRWQGGYGHKESCPRYSCVTNRCDCGALSKP